MEGIQQELPDRNLSCRLFVMNVNFHKESKYFCFLPLQVLSFQKFCLNLYQALLGKGSLYAIKITG